VPSFTEVVAAYEAEHASYQRLAKFAEVELQKAVSAAKLHTMPVTGRAKEPTSFGIKACVGRKYTNPLEQITDKAGVRVMVIYERDVEAAVEVVNETFTCIKVDRKLDALDYDKNGYLGTHLDVQLTADQATGDLASLAGRTFEVQVRTLAQSAWAEVSHDQLYKPPADVPSELKRRIYRLVALVELFDNEVEAFRQAAENTEGYREAAVVTGMGVRLAALGNTRSHKGLLTAELAAAIVPLYDATPKDVTVTLERYIADNEEGLRNVIREGEEAPAKDLNPLLVQPELPMVCERLEQDRVRLEEVWPHAVPEEWLDDLAEKWGLGRPER
jgi:ppGpp synthetase/RelA/SpoT-type nucleotidyltranferase